ncbi:MAG: hypothetical protein NZ700_02130 [Gemmataceae bacterium]|nr:hypothetical protein [Gemmataceae bacterium]MDW8265269.1 hypothetical protein [Gemmataceae bacterium]
MLPAKLPEPPPLVAALHCFLDKRPHDALAHLQHYDKVNQDLLLVLLPLAGRLTEGSLDQASPAEVALLVEQLERLLHPLRLRASLVIDTMCFCRRIGKFGDYEPLPSDHSFKPGDLAQVYVELRNFSTEQRDPYYLTHLSSTLEIHDFTGKTVWRQDFPEDRTRPDRSRSLRHDYFNNYRFCVPEVPAGAYTLWVQITDHGPHGKRTVRRSLDFRVTHPAR